MRCSEVYATHACLAVWFVGGDFHRAGVTVFISAKVSKMNDNPHLLAILESKLAQVRTQLEHNGFSKAKSLLEEVIVYSDDMRGEIMPATRH
jgi:hypothetical protein